MEALILLFIHLVEYVDLTEDLDLIALKMIIRMNDSKNINKIRVIVNANFMVENIIQVKNGIKIYANVSAKLQLNIVYAKKLLGY